jgi:ribosome-associated protein
MEELKLKGSEYIALCDLLKTVGFCESGGQAKSIIADGLVKVDGIVELRKRCKIRVNQVIELDNQQVKVID